MNPLESGKVFEAPENVVEDWAFFVGDGSVVDVGRDPFGHFLLLELHPALGEVNGSLFVGFLFGEF